MILHIKNPCKQEYQVSLACESEDSHHSSHVSELEDSDDSRILTNSRNSLAASLRAPVHTKSALEKTLKVTLDLSSANNKSPMSYASQARQKYFSTSPGRERQGSLSSLAKLTPVLAKKTPEPGFASPVEVPLDSSSALVKVKLPTSPKPKSSAVPLFHITLDKQKRPETRKDSSDDPNKHSRTLSAGHHLMQSPRFGVGGKGSESPLPAFAEGNEGVGKGYSVGEVQGVVGEFRGKFENWKDFRPKVIGRPLRTVLRKQREFIVRTTATWFPGVRPKQDFVVRAMLRGWQHYAGRKAAARHKSVPKPV